MYYVLRALQILKEFGKRGQKRSFKKEASSNFTSKLIPKQKKMKIILTPYFPLTGHYLMFYNSFLYILHFRI